MEILKNSEELIKLIDEVNEYVELYDKLLDSLELNPEQIQYLEFNGEMDISVKYSDFRNQDAWYTLASIELDFPSFECEEDFVTAVLNSWYQEFSELFENFFHILKSLKEMKEFIEENLEKTAEDKSDND